MIWFMTKRFRQMKHLRSFYAAISIQYVTPCTSEEQIIRGKIPVHGTVPVLEVKVPQLAPPWTPPSSGCLALTVDGSFSADGSAGAGMILRNDSAEVILASCQVLFSAIMLSRRKFRRSR